jgi:hypothetical protein
MDNLYFAANPDAKKTASVLLNKADSWNNNVESTGYKEKLKAMWAAYHGCFYDSDGHKISFGGEQGELVQLPINQIRNFAQHILVMTTSNRPSMEARAANTDYKSLVQTTLANGILEYYMREKRLEKYLKDAVEYAIVMGAGYIKMHWNATSGEMVDYIEDTKTPIYEGDIEFTNLSPFDVVVDGTKEHQDHDWVLVRTYKNKFDLAAKYRAFEHKIKELQTKSEQEPFRISMQSFHEETDDVPVFEFYHKKTDSMPDGRYMMFLSEEIILHDSPMPYRVLPVFRIAPSNILGTPHGYSPLFDILPIQEAMNALYSTVLTNQSAFGVQNLWAKSGSNLNVTQLSGGLNLIESNEQPVPLNLCNTPKEIFEFIKILGTVGETLTGVNSVARGNAESLGSNPSGTAMALIQSMALQFMSGLQQSYVALIEDVGSGIIKVLQDFAETPRLITIVGKSNRTYMKSFSNKDISQVSRVYVDVGNPLARTTAGRVQMASDLLQYAGEKINPTQYITLINTGKLEVMTEDIQHELFLIRAENEAIVDGEVPPVTILDDHRTHIGEHRSVLADPDLRKDPALVQRALEHIQLHIEQLRTGDPMLLMMLKQEPLQQPMDPNAAPMPEGSGAAPMEQSPQGQEGMQVQGERMQGPGLEQGAAMPNIPQVDPSLLPAPDMMPQG